MPASILPMRTVLQQAALGLLMSAGTVAICSVPSDTTTDKTLKHVEAGVQMCTLPERPPVDITQRPGDARDGANAKLESPSLRRLRQAEDSGTPRRDYFDERWDEDEPRRPASRTYRRAPRRARDVGETMTRLSSGLESPDADPSAEARVRRFVRFFTESREGRDGFLAALERSGKYEEIITQALDDRRLPRALIAAALVESGFSPSVVSPAGAAGLWQFMPGTAKAYGLRIERGYDERLSPWRSSQAAAEHLADLYEQFRSWELALAAYNMGYNGLVSRLEANKAKTFWELADIDGGLPAETALYVPRVFAAAIVMANLDAFGFDGVVRARPLAASEIEAPPGIPVHILARAAGMPVSSFRELNTELVGTAAPRTGDPVLVHVPTELVERTRANLARLERGEIEPEDLERPRERTAWNGRDGEPRRYGRERGWDYDDRDRGFDRDDPGFARDGSGEGRPLPPWRTARNARAELPRRREWDDAPSVRHAPPYAREAYGWREDDRNDAPPPARRDALDDDRAAQKPRRSETSTVFYRTVEGDTAATVAKTFGVAAEDVYTQNGLKAGAPLDKGTLLRLRVSAKSLEKLSAATAHDG